MFTKTLVCFILLNASLLNKFRVRLVSGQATKMKSLSFNKLSKETKAAPMFRPVINEITFSDLDLLKRNSQRFCIQTFHFLAIPCIYYPCNFESFQSLRNCLTDSTKSDDSNSGTFYILSKHPQWII